MQKFSVVSSFVGRFVGDSVVGMFPVVVCPIVVDLSAVLTSRISAWHVCGGKSTSIGMVFMTGRVGVMSISLLLLQLLVFLLAFLLLCRERCCRIPATASEPFFLSTVFRPFF